MTRGRVPRDSDWARRWLRLRFTHAVGESVKDAISGGGSSEGSDADADAEAESSSDVDDDARVTDEGVDGDRLKLARRATDVPTSLTWLSLRLSDPPIPLPPSVRRRLIGWYSTCESGAGRALAIAGTGSPLVVSKFRARLRRGAC